MLRLPSPRPGTQCRIHSDDGHSLRKGCKYIGESDRDNSLPLGVTGTEDGDVERLGELTASSESVLHADKRMAG